MAKEFNPFLILPDPNAYDEKSVQQLLDENKSPYGKAVMVEIAARPVGTTDEQRLMNRDDLNTVFNPPEGYDRAEWSSKLRSDGHTTLAQMYEHGATASREVAVIPTEEFSRTSPDQSEPQKTTFAYLIEHLPTREMAREFHEHIETLAGRNADTTARLEIADSYLKDINFTENGGFRTDPERMTATREALDKMSAIAEQLREVDFSKDDLMERGGASGSSEYILEATGEVDREFERIDAEDRDLVEGEEREIFTNETERASSNLDEFEIVDNTMLEMADERYEEQDLDLARDGAIFNTSSIRIGGLDQQPSLPGNDQILTDKYLVGTAMPRMTEALQAGMSVAELTAAARNVQQFAGRYLDQQVEVKNILASEQGQQFSERYDQYAQGQLSPADSERLGQEIAGSSLAPKSAATLLEHSAYLTSKSGVDFTDHLKAMGEAEYRNVATEARAAGLDSGQLRAMADSPNLNTRASSTYLERAAEFAERVTAPAGEHTQFREMYADRVKMGTSAIGAEREFAFAERVMMNPQISTRDKELLLAPNTQWETSRAGQSQVEGYVQDYNQIGAERALRIKDNPGLEAFLAKENGHKYGDHLQAIDRAQANGADRADIKAEYQTLPQFTEKFASTVLREDLYVRNSNQSPVFHRALERMTEQKTPEGVAESAKIILDFNTKLAAKQRDGEESAHQKLSTEQRALVSLPGPHTHEFTPEMTQALHSGLMTHATKREMVNNLLEGKTERSEPVQKIMSALDENRDRNGEPDTGKLSRFSVIMNPVTDLNKPLSPTEVAWQVRENVVKLNPAEKDFIYKEVNVMRAEALLAAPHKASPNAREAVARLDESRDHQTLGVRLEESLSKADGKPALTYHEQLYVKAVAKEITEDLHMRRESGERLYGAVPVKSQSYQTYAQSVTDAKADPKADYVAQVRIIEDGKVTVRDNAQGKEFLAREISRETWPTTVPDTIHQRRDTAEARGDNLAEKDPAAQQVFRQVDTMKEYQQDAMNARDALNRHKSEIVERVAEERGQANGAIATRTEWTNTWKNGMQEPGYKEAITANKDALVPMIQDHIAGKVDSREFNGKLDQMALPEGSKEYLREAFTHADTARTSAVAESRGLTDNREFQAQALQQATPQEREMLQAYQHSELVGREKFYGGFEKLDTLIGQATERDHSQERSTERVETERPAQIAEVTDHNLTNQPALREDRFSDDSKEERGVTEERESKAEEREPAAEPERMEIAAAVAQASHYDDMYDR